MVTDLGHYQKYEGYYYHWYRCHICEEISIGRKDRIPFMKSCGCNRYTVKHGHTKYKGKPSPTYSSWCCMKSRCNNPSNTEYAAYGGSGISYCQEWEHFANFLEDMGERPTGTSIDRIDGTKGYSKDNCRWATDMEQVLNRKTTRLVFIEGLGHVTASDISRITGKDRSTIWSWITKGNIDKINELLKPFL